MQGNGIWRRFDFLGCSKLGAGITALDFCKSLDVIIAGKSSNLNMNIAGKQLVRRSKVLGIHFTSSSP